MARGLLSGIMLGGAVGVGVSGVASVLLPMPNPPEVSDAAPQATTVAEVPLEGSGDASSDTDRAVTTTQDASLVTAPQSDNLETLDTAALSAPQQPEAGQATTLAGLSAQGSDSGVDVAPDAPVLPNPQALAPMAPQNADDLSISTEPAQPPAPEVVDEETAFEEEETAPAMSDAVDEGAAQQDAQTDEVTETPIENETAEVAEAEAAPETAKSEEKPAPSEENVVAKDAPSDGQDTPPAAKTQEAAVTKEPALAEEPSALVPESAERALTETDTETAGANVPQIAPVPVPDEVAEDRTEPTETQAQATTDEGRQVPLVRPSIGQPAGTFADRDTGVTIRRPSSAPQAQVDEDAAETEVVTQADAPAAGSDTRPISRFAQDYADPEGKPLMSIVLIDDGSSAVAGAAGIAALRSFPYPLTFAVDASLGDAEERMTIYRNEGFEVLAMIDLPEGAQATDAETAFGVILPQLPQVVGVLEGTKGGLQGAREVSDQVASILLQSGHGLLTQDKGLNTMPKLARKIGVPADPIFRDFDSKGQTAQVIRRFLDQAAFKAGQEGGVVMLGRLRPDTISALLLWGLQDRAGKVALVPVSAVLLREE